MTMKEAMDQRHMVRKYTDCPIPESLTVQLRERIQTYNAAQGLSIRLMTGDSRAFSPIIKLLLAKGVQNYFIMCGEDSPELEEACGYWGAELMLFAQTLGLNTWWVGGTFDRKTTSALTGGKKVVGVIAVGYGRTQGVPHKSKSPGDVSLYQGEEPKWFQDGVAAALLAPTALNKQAFFLRGEADRVSLSCDNGIFTGVDTGLVKYHFELGAGKEHFRWT